MSYLKTIYKIADNSGAKTAMCLTKNRKKIGDIITVVIKTCYPNSIKIKKGEIHKALIVRNKIGLIREDYNLLLFKENFIILLNKDLIPIANRILGPIPLEIKKLNMKEFNNKVENFV